MPSGNYTRPTLMTRFWAKVIKLNDGCWEWQGYIGSRGYGHFWDGEKQVLAHRYSYKIVVGEIPLGFQLDHLCRKRNCVNPSHLELVTNQENCQRGNTGIANKIKTYCPKGHQYTPENTYLYKMTDERQIRCCRICHKEREKIRRERLCPR